MAPIRYGRSYLEGAWWAELRDAYERHPEAPHACAVCGARRYQLHHRTYENLGHEHVADLIALCDSHHEQLHRAWEHHRRWHPADTLAAFTDAWVLVKRRTFATAPLPDLALYRRSRLAAAPDHPGRRGRPGPHLLGLER